MIGIGQVASGCRAAFCVAILAIAAVSPAGAQSPSCDIYEINGLTVGSARGAVRAALGRERTTTRIIDNHRDVATAAEYGDGPATIYVEYDHRINRKPEPRVVLLRAPLPPTDEALTALLERWGAPTVWEGATTRTPSTLGLVVWMDNRCGIVATVFRRRGEWWAGSGGTYLQLETLESVRRGDSPASAALGVGGARSPKAP